MKAFERKYEHLGYVCGIDEVGRGPFAGPVVAGACDSSKMTVIFCTLMIPSSFTEKKG